MASTMDSAPATGDTFRGILGRAVAGDVVAPDRAQAALRSIEDGDVEQVPAIAFLTALRMQGRLQADPVELEAVLRHRAPGPAGPASGFTDILDVVLAGDDLTPDMAQAAFGLILSLIHI